VTIGSIIKKLRRERDITQERLAELLNISASAVSQWETDRVMPDVTQIPVLANIFDVSADLILGINIERKNEKIIEILDTV
jgi:transcriptional regulator with XRE-family HTH domain